MTRNYNLPQKVLDDIYSALYDYCEMYFEVSDASDKLNYLMEFLNTSRDNIKNWMNFIRDALASGEIRDEMFMKIYEKYVKEGIINTNNISEEDFQSIIMDYFENEVGFSIVKSIIETERENFLKDKDRVLDLIESTWKEFAVFPWDVDVKEIIEQYEEFFPEIKNLFYYNEIVMMLEDEIEHEKREYKYEKRLRKYYNEE